MADAFFVQVAADRFAPTELTRGPWDAGAQHGGPPSALAGYIAEHRPGARTDMHVTRCTSEIVRPVPIAPLNVATRVVHSGRSVEVIEVVLTPDDDRPVLRATVLRIRVDTDAAEPHVVSPVVPGPDGVSADAFPFPFEVGYHTAMESRFVAGSFSDRGPATCWMRMRVPLIEGEPITPLSRTLIAADSGNGISNVLDLRQHLFINPDLSVHLHRYPDGEWVCLESNTTIGDGGTGMADTALHDERGRIGRAAQSLFVAPRRD
jgi:acyl-coenzyme A thioesterase PaaI-like protein